VGDIAASTAAQVGATDIVTVDSTGTLGRDTTIRPAIAAIQGVAATQNTAIAALQATSGLSTGRLTALETNQGTLFGLVGQNRKEARRGIAAAIALSSAPFPSESGKTSYTANGSTYRGEYGFGAALAHRFGDVAISVGVSHSGGKDTAGKVGIAGEF
jgi:trimeric autotransporter adhesin